MARRARLTDPTELASFQIATGGEVPRNANGFPCETTDYQVDPPKWANDIRRSNQRTIAGILGHRNAEWQEACFQCEQGRIGCPRGTCVASFHRERMREDWRQQFQIRPTPNNSMGLGVFAGADLVEGQLLDEYFGELIPPRMAALRVDDDYSFQIKNVASSSARDYGNWTRFVNHSCRDFNVEAVDSVLGGRRTITFKAIKNIDQGEELFIDYGKNYFGDGEGDILCKCSASPEPHTPPGQESRDPQPQTQQAFPGPPAQPIVTKPVDVSVAAQNDWIDRNKAWLGERKPNGYPHWTMVHWRFLEQLVRHRHDEKYWQSKTEYTKLPTSRDDPLLKLKVRGDRSQMTIQTWQLDVVKAFQRDGVCGTKQGTRWETKDLLKRIFALRVAVRRRGRRAKKADLRASKSPSIEKPKTPSPKKASGILPTPPSTGGRQRIAPEDFPDLPSDVSPSATVRQARRAGVRRRRQRRSYSP